MNYAPQLMSKPLTTEQAIMYESGKKSTSMGMLFGFLLTGGGQMYAGRIGRGFAFFGAGFVFAMASFFLVGIPFWIGNIIWSLIDAKKCIEQYNIAHLHRITSGQVYHPTLGELAPPMPQPLAPAAPMPLSAPTMPPGPPPPSSTSGLPPANGSTRITLNEEDF